MIITVVFCSVRLLAVCMVHSFARLPPACQFAHFPLPTYRSVWLYLLRYLHAYGLVTFCVFSRSFLTLWISPPPGVDFRSARSWIFTCTHVHRFTIFTHTFCFTYIPIPAVHVYWITFAAKKKKKAFGWCHALPAHRLPLAYVFTTFTCAATFVVIGFVGFVHATCLHAIFD